MNTTVKSPASPKTAERELEQVAAAMIREMSKSFKRQTLETLTKKTRDKFEDTQTGNYSAVYLKLARRATRSLHRRFGEDRIEAFVRKTLNKVNQANKRGLYGAIEKAIGISSKELTAKEGLTATINALVLETTQWMTKLRDDTLQEYTANSLRAMTQGLGLPDILKEYDGLVEKRKNHAKFTARNQIANFNSITTKLRSQKIGIKEAIWVTSRDERVRDCHVKRNGKQFKLSEGLFSSCDGKTILPGVDFQCRCTYELIIPEE